MIHSLSFALWWWLNQLANVLHGMVWCGERSDETYVRHLFFKSLQDTKNRKTNQFRYYYNHSEISCGDLVSISRYTYSSLPLLCSLLILSLYLNMEWTKSHFNRPKVVCKFCFTIYVWLLKHTGILYNEMSHFYATSESCQTPDFS